MCQVSKPENQAKSIVPHLSRHCCYKQVSRLNVWGICVYAHCLQKSRLWNKHGMHTTSTCEWALLQDVLLPSQWQMLPSSLGKQAPWWYPSPILQFDTGPPPVRHNSGVLSCTTTLNTCMVGHAKNLELRCLRNAFCLWLLSYCTRIATHIYLYFQASPYTRQTLTIETCYMCESGTQSIGHRCRNCSEMRSNQHPSIISCQIRIQ
jgi:hypothetical protein